MSVRKHTLLLIFILLLTAFLRFYQIDINPKAMYGDGLTAVYDAYSIFKTGHDQKGNFLPLVFSLGGGRPGGYVYATVPFAAIFGPTALASQMVSVLSGIGIVFLLYLLGRRLLSEKIGLATAAISALNPWALSLSRGPFESHFALFLTLLGFYSFLRGLKQKYWLLLFGLSFGLASQTYSTYRLTIPLLTIILLVWSFHCSGYFSSAIPGRKRKLKILNLEILRQEFLKMTTKKVFLLLSIAIITSSAILGVYLTVSRGKEDRFDIINIFKDPNLRSTVSQKVKSERLLNSLSPTIAYALQTPQLELAGIWAENYFQNFLPNFLFIHGDGQVRHNPGEMGGFFWIDVIFLITGIIYLYQSNKKLLLLLTGWILIAPIPTSMVGGAHALRSSLLLPPLLILTGTGLYKLWSIHKLPYTTIIFTLLTGIFFIQFVYFINRFYFIAPQKNTLAYSYPAKIAAMLAEKNKGKFDFIILSNDIDNMEFAYPTYTKLDPNLVIKQNLSPAKIGEFKFFKYGNIYIGSLPNTRIMQLIKDLPGSALYIGAAKEKTYLENYKTIRGFDKEEELVITAKEGEPDLEITKNSKL